MKRTVLTTIASALVLMSVSVPAADTSTDNRVDPKQLAAAKKKSMAEKGSYHEIHVKGQKLDCDDCHDKEGLPPNTIKLTLYKPLAKGSPGAVSSDNCHECHGKPQDKPVTWYARKGPAKE